MKTCQHGFIIPLTLMLVAVAMIIITAMYQRGTLFVPFSTTMYQREQAKYLALSGVQIAMSQLAQGDFFVQPKTDNQKIENKKNQTLPMKESLSKVFSTIFPKLGVRQTFRLKKIIDGIDGEIGITLSNEEGKINLNMIYDFVQKKFVGEGQSIGDWKKIMQMILQRIQKKIGSSSNLFEGFEKFMKQRQYKINDATELLAIDAFRPFATAQFYDSSFTEKERPLYLLDLFTVYGYGKLQPWFLSDSIRGVLGMKRVPITLASAKKIGITPEFMKKFKESITLQKDWDLFFQPLYGIDLQRLPKEVEGMLGQTFDPRFFSVNAYGKIGKTMVRLYVILERVKRFAKQKIWYDIKIKKFYWL